MVDFISERTYKSNEFKERGAGLVEYALLLALIVVVCVGAVGVLGNSTNDGMEELIEEFEDT